MDVSNERAELRMLTPERCNCSQVMFALHVHAPDTLHALTLFSGTPAAV
jgi:hypothetical protein